MASAQGHGKRQWQRRMKRTHLARTIRVVSWNVGTLTGKCAELAEVMKRRKVHVACLQETRWRGSKAREIGEGYKLYFHGTSNQRNGVAVVVCEEMKSQVVDVQRVSDRLMVVKLSLDCGAVNIISAYAPQVGCSDSEKEEFQGTLDNVMQSLPGGEKVIVGADLNGHVGAGRGGYERNHGGHGHGLRNAEGESILRMAQAHDLAVVNTFFQKKEEHLLTFKSGAGRSQIDYFLVQRAELKGVKDCKVIPGECVAAQHRLLLMKFRLEGAWRKKEVKRCSRKIKWWRLKEASLAKEFKAQVEEKLRQESAGHREANQMWKGIAAVLKEAAVQVLGEVREGKQVHRETKWWNQDVQRCVQEKKTKFKVWQRTRQAEDLQVYLTAKKEAKRAVAKAKTETFEDLYQRLDSKEGHKIVYSLARSRERAMRDITQVRLMKDKEGRVIQEEASIRRRWQEYFGQLLNEENPRGDLQDVERIPGVVEEIKEKEVAEAMRRMQNGKAAGPDGIPIEAFKSLEEAGVTMLAKLFNAILREEKMPDAWRESIIVPIFKGKGDVQECSNYRGIKLMSHAMKLWEKTMNSRLRAMVEIGSCQFGFMPGRSTTDAIFALRTLLEKHREKRKDLHMAFIDLEKAYDRVPRELVWWCMRSRGIPEGYVRLVQDMYRGGQTLVRSACGESESFQVEVGVHQGSALSPFLFLLVMDTVTKDIQQEAPWCMLFADDIVLCSTDKMAVEEQLKQWTDRLEKHGLRVSRTKTEYLVTRFRQAENGEEEIRLGEENLKTVKAFKYLGSIIQDNASLEEEVRNRTRAAWSKWREVSGVVCDRRMPLWLKGKVYKAVLRPVLLYGSECWALKKREEQAIATTEMRMLRWIGGVSLKQHLRNEVVRGQVKVMAITEKMREQRLRWFGHVERREEGYVGKRVQQLQVEGTRSRGRPRLRWLDVVNEDMEQSGLKKEMAQDRRLWRNVSKRADPN